MRNVSPQCLVGSCSTPPGPPDSMKDVNMTVHALSPLLLAPDVEVLRAFYVAAFAAQDGIPAPPGSEGQYATVLLGDRELCISAPQPGQEVAPSILRICVNNAHAVVDAAESAGGEIMWRPRREAWGEVVGAVVDPAGHVLLVIDSED